MLLRLSREFWHKGGNSNYEIRKTECSKQIQRDSFQTLGHSGFEFVSNFVFRISCFLLCFVFVAMFCSSASAHPGREDEEAPPADFLYDEAGETVDAAVFDNPRWYDADVVSSGGALWYAWLEFTPGKGDRVWVGSRDGGKWTPQNEVSGRFGNYARPTLTVDAAGTLWLSYEAEGEDRSWNVFAVPIFAIGSPRIPTAGCGSSGRAIAAGSSTCWPAR